MKKVMVRAWEIARAAAAKFGGSAVEYMSEALRQAWAENKKVTIVTSSGSRNHKSWVARIDGTDARFGFKRTFVDAVDHNWMEKHFELGAGVYEVCDAGERYFIRVAGGTIERINRTEVA